MAKSWGPSLLFSYACSMNEVKENIDHVFIYGEENEKEEGMYKNNAAEVQNLSNESTVMYISSSSGEDSSDYEPYAIKQLGFSEGQYLNTEEKLEDREGEETIIRGGEPEVREEQCYSFSEVIGETFINKEEIGQEEGGEVSNEIVKEVSNEVKLEPERKEVPSYEVKTEPERKEVLSNEVKTESERKGELLNEVKTESESKEETDEGGLLTKVDTEETFMDNKENDGPTCNIVKIEGFEPSYRSYDGFDGSYAVGQRLYKQALARYERLAAIADPDGLDQRQTNRSMNGSNKTHKCTSDAPKSQIKKESRFNRLYNLSKDKQLQGKERRLRIERASANSQVGATVGKLSVREAEKIYYRGIKRLVDIDNRRNEHNQYHFREELKAKAQQFCLNK